MKRPHHYRITTMWNSKKGKTISNSRKWGRCLRKRWPGGEWGKWEMVWERKNKIYSVHVLSCEETEFTNKNV